MVGVLSKTFAPTILKKPTVHPSMRNAGPNPYISIKSPPTMDPINIPIVWAVLKTPIVAPIP